MANRDDNGTWNPGLVFCANLFRTWADTVIQEEVVEPVGWLGIVLNHTLSKLSGYIEWSECKDQEARQSLQLLGGAGFPITARDNGEGAAVMVAE